MARKDSFGGILIQLLVAAVLIAVAAGIRVWPLGELGARIPWVTFYPAVMLSALYGGVFAGAAATAFTIAVVLVWSPTDTPFIRDTGDWLGLGVFTVNCILISAMSEAMLRARKRETLAKEQAEAAKEQAEAAKEQAEAASRAKSIFLANMSHELRTPLNAVLGFARLNKRSRDATIEQIKNLNIIISSGEYLLNLINNVLNLSKIEAGHAVVTITEFNLRDFLNEIKSMNMLRAQEKNLFFDIEVAAGIPENIITERAKLEEVLVNLIGNAVKFTETGGIYLHCEMVGRATSDSAVIRFVVKDTGSGIKSDDIEKIFLPFTQRAPQTIPESGTGLGLTICRQHAKLMKWTIDVSSVVGEGSAFYVTVPVALPLTKKATPTKRRKRDVIGLMDGQERFRLLIAEDQKENRLLLRLLLSPLGFELREATSGKDAVAAYNEWHPHLIWMDIRMPDIDGLEATKIIKASENGAMTKIIALTAHVMEDERREILAAGCDDFICKPYREVELFDALEKHLGIRFRYADEAESASETVPLHMRK